MTQPANKENLFISADYDSIKLTVDEFEQLFSDSDQVIQRGRNTIKQLELDGTQVVVKKFKVPNTIRGFIYKYLQKSKARRSFEYAEKLLAKDISTPKPIAYLEVFSKWKLRQSYLITEKLNYDYDIDDVVKDKTDDTQRLLSEFVAHTYKMHQCGVQHLDYGAGNILITKSDSGYVFSVVDINRMRFGVVTPEAGIKNFNRISKEPDVFEFITEAYSSLSGIEVERARELLLKAKTAYANYWIRKRKFKKLMGR